MAVFGIGHSREARVWCNMAESFKGQWKSYLIKMVGRAREAALVGIWNVPYWAGDYTSSWVPFGSSFWAL